MKPSKPRWLAVAAYWTDKGTLDVPHDLYELSQLHDLIERGPHWDTIDSIIIRRVNHVDSTTLTIEQANEL